MKPGALAGAVVCGISVKLGFVVSMAAGVVCGAEVFIGAADDLDSSA
jgi:hypothetical protein